MTWVPDACTLPTAEQPTRVAEFDAVWATAVRPAERHDPTTLVVHLPGGDDVAATVADLTARETACCSFFTFAIHRFDGATELEVRVPTSQTAVLDALQRRAEEARAGSVSRSSTAATT